MCRAGCGAAERGLGSRGVGEERARGRGDKIAVRAPLAGLRYNIVSHGTMTSGHDAANAAGTPQELSPGLRQLLDRTKYPLMQENGHRRYGPPPDWEGPPPPEGCEVFVGRIPRDMFEDELVPVMERAGRVYDVRLMVDQVVGNRGFGFVQYCTLAEAKNALRTLKEVEVRPRRSLSVSRSVDNKRLFVGGIPKTRTSEEVLEEMRRVTEGVVRVILYSCVHDKSKNRGYTFVEYTNHKAAAMARRKLFSGRLQLWGAEVKVDWAEPEHSVDEDTMAKVTILYIRNLALRTTEDDIRRMCEAFASDVTRVKKQQDYAFVHFGSRKNAERVKEALHGRVVDECELEVSWAKPIKKEECQQKREKRLRSMMSAVNGGQTKLPSSPLPGWGAHDGCATDREAKWNTGHTTHSTPSPWQHPHSTLSQQYSTYTQRPSFPLRHTSSRHPLSWCCPAIPTWPLL
ncbi:hypothetical protein O3P69_009603 [Scylla paramamosain]|uniref:RRM domain-containing protein n=1 Tax=Scylla paramamosain TaxID=85552 RepID=A0AAW0SWA8_SCYPA